MSGRSDADYQRYIDALRELGLEPGATADAICVPGGYRGVIQAMEDRDLIEFVQWQARTAKYVTSVCTGAFILGAAGLLKGRRATTHWGFAELLPLVGATHEKRRVVGCRWFGWQR